MTKVAPGLYRHNPSGNFYEVRHSFDSGLQQVGHFVSRKGNEEIVGEEVVVYRALFNSPDYGLGHTWVQPAEQFLGSVVLGGKEVPLFEPVTPHELSAEAQAAIGYEPQQTLTKGAASE